MNTTTGTERRNARMHKIFENARRLRVDKGYPRLVQCLKDFVRYVAPGDDVPLAAMLADSRALLRDLGEL